MADNDSNNVKLVSAVDILSRSARFDLVYKVALMEAMASGSTATYLRAAAAYLELIRSHIDFFEHCPGEDVRLMPWTYIAKARQVRESVRDYGYDASQPPIPLDREGQLMNGSHRLSACLVSHNPCRAKRHDQLYDLADSGNIATLRRNHLHSAVENFGVRTYFRLNPHARILVVGPALPGSARRISARLADAGLVVWHVKRMGLRLVFAVSQPTGTDIRGLAPRLVPRTATAGEIARLYPDLPFPDWHARAAALWPTALLCRLRIWRYKALLRFRRGHLREKTLLHLREQRMRMLGPVRLACFLDRFPATFDPSRPIALEPPVHAPGTGLRGRLTAFLCRRLWTARDQVVFVQHVGSGFRCNPKYIALELLRRGVKARLVWLGALGGDKLPPGIAHHSLHGLGAVRALARARVIVDNTTLMRFFTRGFVKKPDQTYLQTEHGSMGFKRLASGPAELRYEAWDRRMTDILVSGSRMETEMVYRPLWTSHTRIVECGHARVDVLLAADRERRAAEVRRRLGLLEGVRTFLYAPTFRAGGRSFTGGFDCAAVLAALHDRFGGDWRLLVRAHPCMKAALLATADARTVLDVSGYGDIQELMVLADAMATDYSSCLLDFVVTGRPGFIYAPDLAEYDQERGFYLPLSSYPFPVAETPAAFAQAIRSFDAAAYAAAVKDALARLGCRDDGHAAARAADLVERALADRGRREGDRT